jgi:Asp-tRNA(Asn)/Glu-tRNA(Gln) amidotransferase A subunit family amidase
MSDVTSLSASDAALMIENREIGAEELVNACIARIAERDEVVNAWEYLDAEAAVELARRRSGEPSKGPLHGIPIGLKDIIDTAEMPTSYGSCLYLDHRPMRDAVIVALMREAGAVMLGKTVTTEFASAVPAKTTNPWDSAHTPGGSSSGSAAAVADRMVPLAVGTQTAGSLIRPAAFCGVVGYKPTYGLICRNGIATVAESLDTVGVLARSVADAALLTSVLASWPQLSTVPLERPPRIGICRTHHWARAEPETVRAIDETAEEATKRGAHVADCSLPDSFSSLYEHQTAIMTFEAIRSLSYERLSCYAGLSPELRDFLDGGRRYTIDVYRQALEHAHCSRAALSEVFVEFDVLLTPSAPGLAPRGLTSTGDAIFNGLWSLLHLPCVTLPIYNGSRDLPIGIQLVGPRGGDLRLIATASWVEAEVLRRPCSSA